MMTIMFQDIDSAMQNFDGEDNTPDYIATRDILYADDTILLGASRDQMQYYLDTVVGCARYYGLELNWGKTKLLRIRVDGLISTPDGSNIDCVDQVVYLGALLTSSGIQSKEIARRIGEASTILQQLKSIWSHDNLNISDKQRVFDACVVSKLLYGLESICFRREDFRKINAYFCRCLRLIFKIPQSYISHISSQRVYARANKYPLEYTIIL